MVLKDKILAAGLAGAISLGIAGIGKSAWVDYQISGDAVAYKSQHIVYGFGQHCVKAFDEDGDWKFERILVRNSYIGPKGFTIFFEEIKREDPRFNDLLQKINKK